MTAACPSCSTADHTLLVTAALNDPRGELDRPTRGLLDVPREPKSLSPGSTVLYVLAGLTGALLLTSFFALLQAEGQEFANDATALVVYLLFTTVLAVAGWLVRREARRRRLEQGGWPVSYEQWTLVHKVWRVAWLCRACRVAFFPLGALRPDFPASPPLRYEHFQDWLNETARQTELAGGFLPAAGTPATGTPAA
ncbi:hypothetical protein Kpho02_38800 [Kitasatospora phosalacinea]|uniref:Uncharacterized protein n=1 Tax=Kitasatospora phosalacinea TaxID=2065 RepID=A0A9W6V1D9_9ACTN|nr:hypothetical protein [Kitasatospora phosalacinea]GLW71581.1 hypothetical protein Kpho02_38800 [Kitasatospora phosalacinea]